MAAVAPAELAGLRHRLLPQRHDDRQIDVAGRVPGVEHALRGFDVITRPGKENVVDVSLRIAVVERKPARLDLHHDAVPGQEYVVHLRQREAIALHAARGNGARMSQAVAITAAEDIHRYA